MISAPPMRLLSVIVALVLSPVALWHSLRARRRLRAANALPSGPERLTLRRVA